jgi:NADH-ubiquinone oxidoreductase chain 1
MTEHAAVVFVFFFLAEYGSIVLMCILSSILFLGGYLGLGIGSLGSDLINYINIYFNSYYFSFFSKNSIVEGLFSGLNLGLKSSILIFIFI